MALTHISLFSGIGGIDLAAEWAGFETIAFCECNDYAQKVLRKHWPSVPIIGDVRDVTREKVLAYTHNRGGKSAIRKKGNQWNTEIPHTQPISRGDGGQDISRTDSREERFPPITLITGGVPCQPASVAGKRRGKEDDRWIWPEALRILSEIKPSWAVFENPTGILTLGDGVVFNDLLSGMEAQGYEVQPIIIPACAVNAPHRRDRCFIVGYSKELHQYGSNDKRSSSQSQIPQSGNSDSTEDVADTESIIERGLPFRERTEDTRFAKRGLTKNSQCNGLEEQGHSGIQRRPADSITDPNWWAVESSVCRIFNELSKRLDCCGLSETPYGIMVSVVLKEYSDANAKETRRGKVLQTMPEVNDSEDLQWSPGEQSCFPQEKVLQSEMYGSISDEGNCNKIIAIEKGNKIQGKELPEVRDRKIFSNTSYQWKPSRQLAKQYNDALLVMSHEVALGTWENYMEAEELLLQGLWGACQEIGYVSETLPEIQEVWESLTDKEKDWITIRVATGDPFHREWPDIPRVVTGVKNRGDRLRCLGNAVVPQQVYPILKAIADIERGKL